MSCDITPKSSADRQAQGQTALESCKKVLVTECWCYIDMCEGKSGHAIDALLCDAVGVMGLC